MVGAGSARPRFGADAPMDLGRQSGANAPHSRSRRGVDGEALLGWAGGLVRGFER